MPPAPLQVRDLRKLLACTADDEWKSVILQVKSYLLYMGFLDLCHFEGHEARVYSHVATICTNTFTNIGEWHDPAAAESVNLRLGHCNTFGVYILVNYCLKLLLPKNSDITQAYM